MPKNILTESSQSVQAHLGIMQSVIQRMASNSSSSKAWCITLVSAVLVIVADKGHPEFSWIAIMPTLLFLLLDAYYLSLEKSFRNSYNVFIKKLHDHKLKADDLYLVKPTGSIFKLFFSSLISFSIWPFYLLLLIMIYATRIIITGNCL